VAGYAGFYEVSSLGRVCSLPRATTRGKILKLQLSGKGYWQAGLSKYGKVRIFRVSDLVLTAHVRPRPPGTQACHGRLGKQYDGVDNLYWGTPERNQGPDRVRDGTSNQGERSIRAKMTEPIVADCRRRHLAGVPQVILCAEYGVTSGAMSNAIHGRTWACVTDPPPVPLDRDSRSHRTWTEENRAQVREAGRLGAKTRWGT
jgi:NUMOD4 motif